MKSPRTLRRLIPAALASIMVLASCSNVSSANDAFSVNGNGYKQSDFDILTGVLTSAGQFTAVNGKIKKEDAVVVMRTLIRYSAFEQFIADRKVTISEDDRAMVLKNANADKSFPTYPKPLQDVLLNLNIADVTLKKMAKPTEAELKKLYDKSPASTGTLCLSHILVKTEAEAKTVLADLNKGVKFADEAAKKSIEPGADKSGGSLATGGQACSALANLQGSFDKDFLKGAVAAKPGVPTGPVKSSFGYHIILSHKFDDVKTSVATVVAENPGTTLLAGYLSKADITVKSVYGVWNGATSTIS